MVVLTREKGGILVSLMRERDLLPKGVAMVLIRQYGETTLLWK